MTTSTIDFRTLDSMSAWDIADAFQCHYSGDTNPIEHGGFFYDSRDWREHGYASCVEFWIDPDSPKVYGCPDTLRVTVGTIHRPDNVSDIVKEQYDCDIPDDPDTLLHMEIDACRGYCGVEPDCYQSYDYRYKLSDWKEWRIWKSISPLLASLGN